MRSVRISTIGITNKDFAVITVAVNLADVQNLRLELLTRDDPGGDIAIVNGDAESGKHHIENYNPSQLKVILAEEFVYIPGAKYIERPVRTQDLANTLAILCERLVSAPAVESEELETDVKDDLAVILRQGRNSSVFLLEKLIAARDNCAFVKVDIPKYSSLFVNGKKCSISTRATSSEILLAAKEEGNPPIATPIDESSFQLATSGMPVYPISMVIWCVGLITSNGALLSGHTLDTAVRLKSLPRFPREYMRKHPEYLKLAVIIMKRPMSVKQLHSMTGLEIVKVCDFYNIIFSLGLSYVDENSNVDEGLSKMDSERRGLLSWIAKKIRIAK